MPPAHEGDALHILRAVVGHLVNASTPFQEPRVAVKQDLPWFHPVRRYRRVLQVKVRDDHDVPRCRFDGPTHRSGLVDVGPHHRSVDRPTPAHRRDEHQREAFVGSSRPVGRGCLWNSRDIGVFLLAGYAHRRRDLPSLCMVVEVQL